MSEGTIPPPTELFSLEGQVAVVTGGTGVLGGAKVGVLGRRREKAEATVQTIEAEGGTALALPAHVLDREQLEAARKAVEEQWGRIDVLVNAAGGNMSSATLEPGQSFFDLPVEGMDPVVALNLKGTLLPTQVFGETMARAGRGCIVNVSSMAAARAMTRVVGYGVAKAGGRERHALARGGAGALVRGRNAGQHDRARLLRRRAEPRAAARRGRVANRARADDHRPHAGRTLRRAGRPDRRPDLAVQPRRGLRERRRRAGGRGFGAFSGV